MGLANSVIAQQSADSSSFFFPINKINRLQISSNKHLNTLNFRGNIFYKKDFGNVNYAVDGGYSSAYFFATQKSFRSSHLINTYADYSFYNWLASGFYLKRSYYNDDQRLAISSAEVNQGMLYTKIKLRNIFNIISFGGISNNIQAGLNDSGPIYGVEGNIYRLGIEDLDFNGRFHFSNEDISPRKNSLRNINFILKTVGNNIFQNYLFAGFNETRKDFYTPIDSTLSSVFDVTNNIESRTESNYSIKDKFRVFLSKKSHFDISGKINKKNVARSKRYILSSLATTSTFDPIVNRLSINIVGAFSHIEEDLQVSVNGGFNSREETFTVKEIDGANDIFYSLRQNQESKKDNVSKLEFITGSLKYNLSSKNILYFSLYQRKLKYDTPSEENFDDRDELLTMLRLRFTRKFNPFFTMHFNLEGSQNHLVYIFAERSSNNNIKRILKFSGEGVYRGKYVTSKNSAEVSANYTVYDFEDITQNYQSYAFRQFIAKDSSSIRISRLFSINTFAYTKISEQGEFSWKSFSEKPFQYRSEIYAEPSLFLTYNLFNIGLGLRYYELKNYNYSLLQLTPVSDYSSLGPSLRIITPFSEIIRLSFYGWYEFVNKDNTPTQKQTNFNLSFYWNL